MSCVLLLFLSWLLSVSVVVVACFGVAVTYVWLQQDGDQGDVKGTVKLANKTGSK